MTTFLCACSSRNRSWLLLVVLAASCPLFATEGTGEQLTERVYQRLVRAAGVPNSPKLIVQPWRQNAAERVAFLRIIPDHPPRREIVIDDKTIAICESMGEQAEGCLAYFLGHELAHFVHDDNWGSHFARQTVSRGVSVARSLEYETQADRFGGFYATLAGYDSLSVASRALEMVYHEYGIAPNLEGYQPLAERKRQPEEAHEFLSKLVPMFDAAGLLMALGNYQEAAVLYGAVLEQFPSREIYNNAGVALASVYNATIPWLLDGSTRLPGRGKQRGNLDLAAAAAQASEYFEEAIRRDREYAVAHLNLGLLLQAVGDEPERAVAEFKTAVRLSKGNAIIKAVARGDTPATEQEVGSDGASLPQSALLPGGKRPSDLAPARPEPLIRLAGGVTFFSRSMNGTSVFSVGPIGPDGKRLYAVLVPQVPEEWRGHLGPGKAIKLFAENEMLFESVGALLSLRGALVYQVR